MAVSFKTPVTATGTNSVAFALSGVTSGQPIILFCGRDGLASYSVADTFSTHYTWTRVTASSRAICLIGTGGAGTSGTVTFTTGAAVANGGVAIACIGASTASGTAALDRVYETSSSGTEFGPVATPSTAGDGALFAVCGTSPATITSSPGSPWSDTAFTCFSSGTGGLALRTSPTVGTPLEAIWEFSASTVATAFAILIKEAQVPTPPTSVTATPGNHAATVSFTAPTDNGGAAITDYTVTASPGGATATENATSITVTGLTNGVTYTFTVKATNSSGTSTASAASNAVTPGTVAGAPVLSGGAASTAAILTWDPPLTDGGAVILGYYAYQGTSSGGESTTPVSPGLITGTSVTVTGLTNGTTSYFKVKTVNSWGQSVASNEVSVTPSLSLSTLTAPSLSAVAIEDGNIPAISLTVTNNQGIVTGVATTMLVTLLRTDGTYVLGASPSSPLLLGAPVTTTALTLYATATRTGTLAKLSPSYLTTATATHVGGRIGTSTAYWPVTLGATSSTSYTTPPTAAQMKGALWPVATLAGKQLQAGSWSARVRLKLTSTTATGTLYFAVFRKNGSTYTQIGSALSATVTIGTTFATHTITGTLPAATFNSGTELYIGFYFHGHSGSASDTILKSSVGIAYVKIITPSYATPAIGSPVATVIDYTAPYGVPSTYTAFLTYGGATGASAAQSVVMPQAPDTTALYGRLGWAKSEDATGQLLAWLSGIGDMIQAIDSLSTDGFDLEGHSAPGWSQVLDIDRCPTEALPWLAQFLGVRLNPNLRDDQQRFAIKNPQGFGRGTPAAIIAAANLYLSPGYTALLAERDTGAYHLTLRIPTVAIAGLSTCESVWLEYQTCTALAAAFAACSTLWKIPEEITVSVKAAIPAGLAYTISYD